MDEHGTIHLVLRNGSLGIDTKCGMQAVTVPLHLLSSIKVGSARCHTCYLKEKKAKQT